MKKRKILIAIIIVIVLVLLVPLPPVVYRDGGTKDYRALTYRVVVWNRFMESTNTDAIDIYHKTSIYWFPHNRGSIDELWARETAAPR